MVVLLCRMIIGAVHATKPGLGGAFSGRAYRHIDLVGGQAWNRGATSRQRVELEGSWGCGCPQPACVPCPYTPQAYAPYPTVPAPYVPRFALSPTLVIARGRAALNPTAPLQALVSTTCRLLFSDLDLQCIRAATCRPKPVRPGANSSPPVAPQRLRA